MALSGMNRRPGNMHKRIFQAMFRDPDTESSESQRRGGPTPPPAALRVKPSRSLPLPPAPARLTARPALGWDGPLPSERVNHASIMKTHLVTARLTRNELRLRAERAITEILAGAPTIFKIGITSHPRARWQQYAEEGYAAMHLLYASADARLIEALETDLIAALRRRQGCRNTNPGGEGAMYRFSPPYFLYVAAQPCGSLGLVGRKRPRISQT